MKVILDLDDAVLLMLYYDVKDNPTTIKEILDAAVYENMAREICEKYGFDFAEVDRICEKIKRGRVVFHDPSDW